MIFYLTGYWEKKIWLFNLRSECNMNFHTYVENETYDKFMLNICFSTEMCSRDKSIFNKCVQVDTHLYFLLVLVSLIVLLCFIIVNSQ